MPSNHSLSGNKKRKNFQNIGLIQFFDINEFEEVENTIQDFKKLGITQIRTNVSWADWQQPEGKKWYDWLFQTLGKDLEILPCLLQTQPGVNLEHNPSLPANLTESYTNFADQVITAYGQYFDYIELWNEPNNPEAYNYTSDKDWSTFCEMMNSAAQCCQTRGKKTVLGGMHPIDPNWLHLMFQKNMMQHIDVVGLHAFPGIYHTKWESWEFELNRIQQVLNHYNSNADLWITAAGYSTLKKDERQQLQEFIDAINSNAARIYWYALKDKSRNSSSTNDLPLDERAYHFGIKHADNSPKLLYTLLTSEGIHSIEKYNWLANPVIGKAGKEKYTLITGGAGFVGVNLADRILSEGKPVMIFDNLSRAGVQNNLFWLKEKHPHNLQIMIADIRDKVAVQEAVNGADHVFHFAAQVAVTSSLVNPFHDFEVNAQGTLNLLEAMRAAENPPSIIFTSTNKVYGELSDLGMVMNGTRYHPENMHFRQNGISEERNLDFHSPYGCSKGVADQYIIDYGRTFGLKTVVFRMSCIYGPHQFGTEDQGWVAHFLIQALKNKPITLYGDGKQVRDILFVEDLVNAFMLAYENIDDITGNAFNIGGGVKNTVSLLELINTISNLTGKQTDVSFSEWRPGDQKYYVSDFKKFTTATGWVPKVGTTEGVTLLYEWLMENAVLPSTKNKQKQKDAQLAK